MEKVNIDLSDIFDYIGSSRPIKEGEAVYKAGHVTMCGLKNTDLNTVFGFCLQTSNLNGAPHFIEVLLKPNLQGKCTCKAGLGGKCKHIVAVLLHVNRAEELEKLSCTDVEQVWGQPGTKTKEVLQYSKAIPMSDFCHPNQKKPKLQPAIDTCTMEKDILNVLKQSDAESAFCTFLRGRTCSSQQLRSCSNDDAEHLKTYKFILSYMKQSNQILESECNVHSDLKTDFYKMYIENADCEKIFLETIFQNNDIWQKNRNFRITGSSCYSIYTYSSNRNPDWGKKVNALFNSQFRGTTATQYGKDQEENARKLYSDISNQNVMICGLVVNQMAPWLGFSPDGITDNGFLLEIKSPVSGASQPVENILSTLNYLYLKNGEYFLKEQHSYYGQVQLGMLLLNLDYADFVIYCSFGDKSLHIIKIKKNIEFCHKLISVLKYVYFEKMLPLFKKV